MLVLHHQLSLCRKMKIIKYNNITFYHIEYSINYYISKCGQVLSTYRKNGSNLNLLKVQKHKLGYEFVILKYDGKPHGRYIHQLLAETFIPNPDNKPCVNHKNGIKTDNRVENLEWCTHSENLEHSREILGNRPVWEGKLGKDHPLSKKVKQIDVNTWEVLKIWDSIIDVERELSILHPGVCRACKTGSVAGGYFWEYCR